MCCCQQEPGYELPANAAKLLAGDTLKSWKLAYRYNGGVRVSMGPCYYGYRQIFKTDGTFHDNNGEQKADCGESMQGSWYLRRDKENRPYLSLKSSLIPAAFGIDKDIKDFQIVELSDQKLVLRFRHALFTSKTTLIEDTLVPEDVEVADRDFHW
ncbi:hypothetical protein D770_15460 [Flammeovirgaceae bacterium 311]|nr:hypothetical protein D770_15460 [Flammeovirgaceae bacterium 311]